MDKPTIAEKVKFWQEQDRINKALIPRLIKTHELVVETGKQLNFMSNSLVISESKMNAKLDEINLIKNEIEELKNNAARLESSLGNLEGLNELKIKLEKIKHQSLYFFGTALFISIVGLVVSFMR